MARVARVEFGGTARHQYCPLPEYPLRPGDVVVAETDWGVGMGTVGALLEGFPLNGGKAPVRQILRRATPIDLSRRAALAEREREARAFCRERIRARGLPMRLTEVRIGLDSSKAMFYFTAEGRVDFRELVKDLTQHLRTRVELRQIGVRDEAKVLGAVGPCGQPLCCRAFLQTFAPVSIRMAKDQNLALNPAKLSGMCGRLKCCLAYEHPLYAAEAPARVGTVTSGGPGVGPEIWQTVLVALETGDRCGEAAAPAPPPGRERPRGAQRRRRGPGRGRTGWPPGGRVFLAAPSAPFG
jgi:cell fate regulator YaaT (PSP1 superfamily)